jgi:hypothetical protein
MTKKLALKVPKSLGACADKLFDIKQERLAAQKIVDALKADETLLSNHIIDNLAKGDAGAVGKHHKVIVKTEEVPQVKDWEAFYAYVKANNAFDLLQRRINPAALKDREEALADNKRAKVKVIPGTEKFTAVKLSLTQVK